MEIIIWLCIALVVVFVLAAIFDWRIPVPEWLDSESETRADNYSSERPIGEALRQADRNEK